jgi:hypothetical protein
VRSPHARYSALRHVGRCGAGTGLPSRMRAGHDAPGCVLRRMTTASAMRRGPLRGHAPRWCLGQQRTRGDIDVAGTEGPPGRRMIGCQQFRYDRGGQLMQTHQGTWNSISPPFCTCFFAQTVFDRISRRKVPRRTKYHGREFFQREKKTGSKFQVDSSRYRRRGARAVVVAKNIRSERVIQ